jgi:hypothetical protein
MQTPPLPRGAQEVLQGQEEVQGTARARRTGDIRESHIQSEYPRSSGHVSAYYRETSGVHGIHVRQGYAEPSEAHHMERVFNEPSIPDPKLRSEDRLYEVSYKEALSLYNREKQTYETQKTNVFGIILGDSVPRWLKTG